MKKPIIIALCVCAALIASALITVAVAPQKLFGDDVETEAEAAVPEDSMEAPISIALALDPSAAADPAELLDARPETTIMLSFVGDCMLATDRGGEYEGSFNKLAKEVDPSYFFENFIQLFEDDDWTVANLENVFTDDPEATARAKGYSPAYWYKSTTKNTDILNAGSIEIVSLANNHSEDYGAIGYEDTREALEAAGVMWGDNDNILLLEKDGFTVALYLCTFYYRGSEGLITQKLAEVDADYKIVYFHGGTERVHEPDEWKANGARYMADNGVDLVIGGHPHVLQPIEVHNGKTIVHSLGNFVFGGSRSEENRTIVYRTTLTVADGILLDVTDEVIPCYVYTDLYKPGIITDEAEIAAVNAFLAGESESPLK